MSLREVTDPELLKKLSVMESLQNNNKLKAVTDPSLSTKLYLSQYPEEGWKDALLNAPGRAYQDTTGAISGLINKIPDYYQSAKTELPGFMPSLMHHPRSMLRQGVAGINEAINSIAQKPLNIAQYGAGRLNLLPRSVPEAIAKVTPEDTSDAINQVFGQPQYPGEAAFRGAARNLPTILVGGKLISETLPYLTTRKGLMKPIIRTHDELEDRAAQGFKDVSNEVKARNINNVPTHTINFQDLENYFPKTQQAYNLLSDASMGDYDSLRKIQSELYKTGKKNLGSDLDSERMKGAEKLDRREIINQAIADHLQNTNNLDLADTLNNARLDYKTLRDIYYNPNMNNAIVNMVNRSYRKVPKNLGDILKEESIPMDQLLDFHRGLRDKVMKYGRMTTIGKYAKRALVGALSGLGIAAEYEHYRKGR